VLEQTVNEWTYAGRGREEQQQSKDDKHRDHRNQPPHFAFPQENENVAEKAGVRRESF
jgi:hypothetical protein